ncbi:HD domain-containing protein [Rhodospirillum rubrum]|uniref:HD domain-containing protein n=1 Tax=Rhodospirillum rubrum TaxID=1085 RepID=UPI0019070659|nr:HD domain-containing protein [Rhodospirillum rubrum]
MAHHDNRTTQMGSSVIINAGWYKAPPAFRRQPILVTKEAKVDDTVFEGRIVCYGSYALWKAASGKDGNLLHWILGKRERSIWGGAVTTSLGAQRIRDPLHDLIVFDLKNQFECVIWQIIQTPQFQRLRRVKQLGFSDFVYPGATHTRFSHSIGVFHTARRLMEIIRRHILSSGNQVQEHQLNVALAAALVHDIGHGMFSHAFEGIGKKLHIEMARHERVSAAMIKDTEIRRVFEPLGRCFADEVADVIAGEKPGNLYDAVVSSQFDADRLDYMRRDRLMTGVQNSAIDLDWLFANLEVAKVQNGVDDEPLPEIETFVLGPKAFHAAETYVLALFQLYPTVYFHKATRAAEKVFSVLMTRAIGLIREGGEERTGLPTNHPIVRFAKEPDQLEHAQNLDDTVFWGSLSFLEAASDPIIAEAAGRLKDRRLPKCIDLYAKVRHSSCSQKSALITQTNADVRKEAEKREERLTTSIRTRLEAWSDENSADRFPRILVDVAERTPYKPFGQATGPLKQILIRTPEQGVRDMAELSPVIASIETFRVFRAYVREGDDDARRCVDETVADVIAEETGGRENV